jgi:hypothetical protein
MTATDGMYADNAIDIDNHRMALTEALNTALSALTRAANSIRVLRSNQVYDIEFSEGHAGDDVTAFIDDSLRNTRAAYAIAHTVTERG